MVLLPLLEHFKSQGTHPFTNQPRLTGNQYFIYNLFLQLSELEDAVTNGLLFYRTASQMLEVSHLMPPTSYAQQPNVPRSYNCFIIILTDLLYLESKSLPIFQPLWTKRQHLCSWPIATISYCFHPDQILERKWSSVIQLFQLLKIFYKLWYFE